MNCFMFPGQPFSPCAPLPADADGRAIGELVRRHAGYDLAAASWLGAQGSSQVALQLQGVAQSLYQLRRLRRLGVGPGLVAQHSMGIYPALVACGSVTEAQAIELTWRIGACLARMGSDRRWGAGCVVGLPLEQVEAIAVNHQVYLANHNTSRHFLLSGERGAIARALAEALDTGAFSARSFDCDAPVHTPLVGELEGELAAICSGYRYAEPAYPLMNHLNQNYLEASDIAWFLLRELQLPVYWERTYRALRAAGAARLYEVGAGESLSKFNRWIDSEASPAEAPVCR